MKLETERILPQIRKVETKRTAGAGVRRERGNLDVTTTEEEEEEEKNYYYFFFYYGIV